MRFYGGCRREPAAGAIEGGGQDHFTFSVAVEIRNLAGCAQVPFGRVQRRRNDRDGTGEAESRTGRIGQVVACCCEEVIAAADEVGATRVFRTRPGLIRADNNIGRAVAVHVARADPHAEAVLQVFAEQRRRRERLGWIGQVHGSSVSAAARNSEPPRTMVRAPAPSRPPVGE